MARPFRDRRYAVEPLFVIAVLFALAAPLFWLRGEVEHATVGAAYENARLYQWTYPQAHYLQQRFHQGEAPLWNPQQLGGTALLADPRTALFQPLTAVLLFAPEGKALAVHAFLCLFLMGSFFSLFARSLGAGYLPAFLGGLAYAFSGASSAAMSRPGMAAALAWAPAVWWGVHEFSQRPTRARATLAGLLTAVLLLSGGTALAAVFVVTAAAWLVVRTARTRPPVTAIALLVATAAAVSSVQWLPSVGWAAWAQYNNGLLWDFDVAGRYPSGFGDLIQQLLIAQRSTLPAVVYVGVVGLLTVPAAFANRPQRSTAAFFAGLALVGGLAGTLARGPWWFRFPPQALLFPAVFAVAVLAALGFDALLKATPEAGASRRRLYALYILPALLVFYLAPGGTRGYVIAAIAVLAPALVFRNAWARGVSGVLAGLLVFSELFYSTGNSYRHPYADAPGVYQTHAGLFDVAEEQTLGGRLLVDAQALNFALPANAGLLQPVRVAGGAFLPLSEAQAEWWRRAWGRTSPPLGSLEPTPPFGPSSALMNLMGARVILEGPNAPSLAGAFEKAGTPLRLIREENGVRCYENRAALPRAYWVPAWHRGADAVEAVHRVAQPDFEPERECVITGSAAGLEAVRALNVPEAPLAPGYFPTRSGVPCRITEDLPERITVEVAAPVPGILVLADSYAPGWRVQVNGEDAVLVQANGIFRGVPLAAGSSEVTFAYRPVLYPVGLGISLGTLVLIILFGLSALYRPATPTRWFRAVSR